MRFSKVVKDFENDNICVVGLRGTGKDVLMGNVIARRKLPYISNLNYGGNFAHLYDCDLSLGGNTYKNLINGDVKYYKWKYPENVDIYISDVGCYYPSQYCNELNKEYKNIPMFMALSRQIAKNNVHINVQNFNRCWDKLREMSGLYYRCLKCIHIGRLCIMNVIIYDRYQSCIDRISPCRIRVPMFNKEAQMDAKIYRDKFYNTHGRVEQRKLIFIDKSKHDTYYFKELFENGKKESKNN